MSTIGLFYAKLEVEKFNTKENFGLWKKSTKVV